MMAATFRKLLISVGMALGLLGCLDATDAAEPGGDGVDKAGALWWHRDQFFGLSNDMRYTNKPQTTGSVWTLRPAGSALRAYLNASIAEGDRTFHAGALEMAIGGQLSFDEVSRRVRDAFVDTWDCWGYYDQSGGDVEFAPGEIVLYSGYNVNDQYIPNSYDVASTQRCAITPGGDQSLMVWAAPAAGAPAEQMPRPKAWNLWLPEAQHSNYTAWSTNVAVAASFAVGKGKTSGYVVALADYASLKSDETMLMTPDAFREHEVVVMGGDDRKVCGDGGFEVVYANLAPEQRAAVDSYKH